MNIVKFPITKNGNDDIDERLCTIDTPHPPKKEKEGRKEGGEGRKKNEEKKNIAKKDLLERSPFAILDIHSERATPSQHHDCCLSTRREESASVREREQRAAVEGGEAREGEGNF